MKRSELHEWMIWGLKRFGEVASVFNFDAPPHVIEYFIQMHS